MKFRHLAPWFSMVALLVVGATFIRAQPPEQRREGPARIDRGKLRAEIIKLRTEVEMLRFDYELARDGLLDEVKMSRGLRMVGPLMGLGAAIQSAVNEAGSQPPGAAPRQKSQAHQKKAAEEAKAAEREEKKQEAEEAAAIAERKKELARRFALLSEKRLDLEDAERNYREISPAR
jgi:hypothetical protein